MSLWKILGTALVADYIVSSSANRVAETVVTTTALSDSLAERRHAELIRSLEPHEPDPLDDQRFITQGLLSTQPGLSPAEANLERSIKLEEAEHLARLNDREVEDYG